MTDIQKCLLELASITLGNEEADLSKLQVADWELLIRTGSIQGLNTMLYPVVESLPHSSRPDEAMLKAWKERIRQFAVIQLFYIQQVYNILEELRQAGVPAIVIKGPAISRFYNKPEYRLMSDIDILVEGMFLPQAQKVIENMGYVLEGEDNFLHYGYHKPGAISIELHYDLLHSGLIGNRNSNEWYRHIWEHCRTITSEGLTFTAMCVEDELINQIVHFATHFVFIGTRLKLLYDIALIVKSCYVELDWEYVGKMLNTTGFLEFGKLLLLVCHTSFHVPVPEKFKELKGANPQQFMNDLLNYYSVEGTPGDFTGWITIISKFPFLCRYPALYPVAWLIEHATQFKVHPWKPGFVLKNSLRNIRMFNSKARVLRQFKLIA